MKQHFPLLKQFKEWTQLSTEDAIESVSTLTAMIVHTSDFGGVVQEFSISQEWSRRVNKEFINQY